MSNIQQFIQDAIDGGWKELSMYSHWEMGEYGNTVVCGVNTLTVISVEKFLLRPSFWQAVGKTRGWKKKEWADRQLHFIIRIQDGLSIEDSLGKIV